MLELNVICRIDVLEIRFHFTSVWVHLHHGVGKEHLGQITTLDVSLEDANLSTFVLRFYE